MARAKGQRVHLQRIKLRRDLHGNVPRVSVLCCIVVAYPAAFHVKRIPAASRRSAVRKVPADEKSEGGATARRYRGADRERAYLALPFRTGLCLRRVVEAAISSKVVPEAENVPVPMV